MGLFDKMKDTASQAMTDARQSASRIRSGSATPAPVEHSAIAADGGEKPLFEVISHDKGKNAKVALWSDRIEWERARGVSAGKVTMGVMTAGASLLATGVKGGKDAYDMVLLENITNVANRKDGVLYHLVEVQTASGGAVNSVQFRVSRDEAAKFREAILDAMRALKTSSHRTLDVGSSQAVSTSASSVDYAAQLHQIAGLRDAGILNDAEFEAKKAEILARM